MGFNLRGVRADSMCSGRGWLSQIGRQRICLGRIFSTLWAAVTGKHMPLLRRVSLEHLPPAIHAAPSTAFANTTNDGMHLTKA